MRRPGLLALTLVAVFLALFAQPAAAADTWTLNVLSIDATIQPNGTVAVNEEIRVDFGYQQYHGIYRDLALQVDCVGPDSGQPQALNACPDGHVREYGIRVVSASYADGTSVPYTVSTHDVFRRINIGDPDKKITGKQEYALRYEIDGLLDAYSDHDELYWNATGTWPVVIQNVSVNVHLPNGTPLQSVTCSQGEQGSTDKCNVLSSGSTAEFEGRGLLFSGEQLTVKVGWPKGIVTIQPYKEFKPLGVDDFFTLDWIELGGMGLVAVLSAVALFWLWWHKGRDRRYKTLHYLTNDPTEETKPLFGHTDVVVEFLPPDDLRPAEMGLILDEKADTRDITATIVDLAVRGYLQITEIPKEGFFGHKGWRLTKRDRESDLKKYERTLYDALFANGRDVEVSTLKNTFASKLERVKKDLYEDGMSKSWFSSKPETARLGWLFAGIGLDTAGILLALGSGFLIGRSLIFAPLVLAGTVLMIMSRAMARRTATGSEAMRRVLGFRLYVATAETRMQEFNEQQNIFARYLPYAITFRCVDKWAKAFKGLEADAQASTAGWYAGVGAFEVMSFSNSLQGFSSSMTSTMSSTPGSSGGGGGGGAGGGGGGGGGGAW